MMNEELGMKESGDMRPAALADATERVPPVSAAQDDKYRHS